MSESDRMPSQIQWKLYRAKQHFEELRLEVAPWMNANPGTLIPAPESTPEREVFIYGSKEQVPARFGLIAGDYLSNLRSVLDYSVWQMILANGKIPHKTRTGFPVCKSQKAFNDCRDKKLCGLPAGAISLIESLQPYPERRSNGIPSALEALDELNNENKHRQVLFTSLFSIFKTDEPVPFPHIELEITRFRGGNAIPGERLLAFLAFQEGFAKGMEVTSALASLMNYVGYEFLPSIEEFF